MWFSIVQWLRKVYNKIVHSVAFVPALIMVLFLLLSFLFRKLELSGVVDRLGILRDWFSLQDIDTARTIVATVIAGILSLAVFSFSMLMIVMNQAAGKMSNRILDDLIGKRSQKLILGFYIGTIAFAFAQLSNISESSDEGYVPSFSIYFLMLLTMLDIFLFVYFLHFITQSVMYGHLIKGIYLKTRHHLGSRVKRAAHVDASSLQTEHWRVLHSNQSGYFQRFNRDILLRICTRENIRVRFLRHQGEYVMEGVPLLEISGAWPAEKCILEMYAAIDFFYGHQLEFNPYYGFQQLMEIAIKALSPGVNDPGTAVLCLNVLFDLLCKRMHHAAFNTYADKTGKVRIITKEKTIEHIFEEAILPIWDYGKNDRMIQQAFAELISQSASNPDHAKFSKMFAALKDQLALHQRNHRT